MNAVSYSDLRQNLKAYMDKVYNDYEPIIITRKNNENLVMISIEEYNNLLETHYLLSNKANADHLLKSINQLDAGKIQQREMIENE